MYHYTIQPTYQLNNAYQQQQPSVNPIVSEIKSSSDNTLSALNQYNRTSQNAATVTADTENKTHIAAAQIQKNINSVKKTSVDTSNFSIEERLVAAVWVHERNRTDVGISQIKRDFRQRFGREPPSKNTLLAWERKLFSTGSVCDAPRPGRPINRLSRVAEVLSSVRASPALSVRARARQLRLPRSTLRTILGRDLAHSHAAHGKEPINTDANNSKRKTKVPAAKTRAS